MLENEFHTVQDHNLRALNFHPGRVRDLLFEIELEFVSHGFGPNVLRIDASTHFHVCYRKREKKALNHRLRWRLRRRYAVSADYTKP